MIGFSTPVRRPGRAPGRLCSETGGAGAVRVEPGVEDAAALRSVLGVDMDPSEIVLLVCGRSWWVNTLVGSIAGVIAGLAAWFIPHATAWSPVFIGNAVGAAVFTLEHARRLYVLTDRRVMRRDRRLTRVVCVEAPLSSVREVRLVRNDLQARVGVGTIAYATDLGVITWSSVGDAERIQKIAEHAVRRYGGSVRGM